MMTNFHRLLKRQLKKHLSQQEQCSPEFQKFFSVINDAYIEFDSDRKMLERSLELSSRELLQVNTEMRAVFQGFPDSLFLVDNCGTIIDCKLGKENILELKPRDLMGKKICKTPLVEFSQLMLKSINSVLSSKQTEILETSIKINGGERFFETRMLPVSVDHVIIIIRDVTTTKKAKIALQMSETKYRTQFETATDAIFIMKDGYFFDCNPQTLIIFNCTRSEIIGQTPYKFSPEVQPDKQASHVKSKDLIIKALGGEPQFFEWKHSQLDGSLFDAEVSLKRFEIEEDVFIMAIVRNITDRKRAQLERDQEKEKLSVTLESIKDGVISTKVDGTVMLMNRVAEEITGWSEKEAVGKPLQSIVKAHDERTGHKIENLIEDIIQTGKTIELNDHIVLTAKDNTQKDISKCGGPIRDNQNEIIGVVLVIKDITERKKIEEEIFKAKKLESIGVLAGGIAHDFNNILTGILGNITLAKMSLERGKNVADKLLNAEKAALRARELTQQFLTFSRGGAPVKQTASVVELIEESIRFILRGSNVKSDISIPQDLWPADIDKGQINQVINNMIINASQAMPDGGTVTIHGENFIANHAANLPLEPGKYIKIVIIDQGIGIPPENQKKIFDPYFTTKEHGSGLGLASSYGIIKKHGGHIYVNSTPGNGATFTFYLPASDEDIEETKTLTIKKGHGRILLMDDEEVVRESTAEQLRHLGYEVETAENGEELLELYTDEEEIGETFELVIMDLTVPGGMGGEKTMEYLLEMNPDVRAIVVSGYSNNPVMADHKKYGFSGVVKKPFKIEELSDEVQRVLSEEKEDNLLK
ncbi:MAG: PAS domain S-box protein [bacterium]|nr:PAS domain S-box protein [bacterium]